VRGDIVVGMLAQVALGVGVVHLLGNAGHCKRGRHRRSFRRPARQRRERGPRQSGIEKHGGYTEGKELHRLLLLSKLTVVGASKENEAERTTCTPGPD
jgi:hypothetical protein